MKLSSEDIKELKYEKRFGFIFPAMIVALVVLLNTLYFLTQPEPNMVYVILFNTTVLLLSLLLNYKMNHKLNMDLRKGIKISKRAEVQDKEHIASSEAGSGMLYIPILGDLFPKLWGQKMRLKKYYILVLNNTRYEVDQNLYEAVTVGDEVNIYYAENSNSQLGIEKHR